MTNAHIIALAIVILMIMACSILIIAVIREEADRIISALRGEGAGPRRIDGRKPGVVIVDDAKVVDRRG